MSPTTEAIPGAPLRRRPSGRARLVLPALAAVVLAGLVVARPVADRVLAARLESAAAQRGLTASWASLRWTGWLAVRADSLVLRNAGGDTAATIRDLELTVAPLSVLTLHPRPGAIRLDGARIALHRRAAADTLDDDPPPPPRGRPQRTADPERAARLRRSADQLVRMLLLPARRLPRLDITDLVLIGAGGGDGTGIAVDSLTVAPSGPRTRLRIRGRLRSEQVQPFEAAFDYGADDRLDGSARLLVPRPYTETPDTLTLRIAGRVEQDRAHDIVRLGADTRITVGSLPLRASGSVWRRGPRVELDLAADGIGEDQVHASLPPSMLGPLLRVSVRGTFDYRLHFDLDLARPDSVDFHADVIPHGLALDGDRTRLGLTSLDAPFIATIHLPHDRRVTRALNDANPHFRSLDRIDSLLVYAVVTNEDGGFFHHRGFNPEAVRQSIAENVRAGAYRRGAGTITMQLARNLWLGHARTLSRKMQEVVLAWILEHLTGVSKRRLLEIYLNIIEWGPDVHGADEATTYYFGHDAGRVTVDEALFLTTIVPAPTRWRGRFDATGTLRPFERAQMHFIGRAMVAKGWLDPSRLPPEDSLRVELRGPARDIVFPPPAAPLAPARTVETLRLDSPGIHAISGGLAAFER